MASFCPQMCIKSFSARLCSGPIWLSLWHLYMLIKVPVCCNLVLVYRSCGPWKSFNVILTNGQEPWTLNPLHHSHTIYESVSYVGLIVNRSNSITEVTVYMYMRPDCQCCIVLWEIFLQHSYKWFYWYWFIGWIVPDIKWYLHFSVNKNGFCLVRHLKLLAVQRLRLKQLRLRLLTVWLWSVYVMILSD